MLSCADITHSTSQQKYSTETQNEADKSQVLSSTASGEVEDEAVEKGVETFKIANNKMQANAASIQHSTIINNIDTSSYNIATNVASKLDENNAVVAISSRRSSSCSNSSLKQTQQSINLRLRQQRLLDKQQQQLERTLADGGGIGSSSSSKKRKHNRNRKISHKQENDTESDDAKVQIDEESRKPRLIKRIKIGIYGDVATTQQIALGSNSNNSNSSSTDDDGMITNYAIDCTSQSALNFGEICAADDNIFNSNNCPTALEDADMYKCINDDDNHNDITSNKYDAAVVGAAPDEIEIDDDEEADYADFDDEEEYEEEYYIGDFHEVVTRDISLPATGNNHIVLTIKKTPSKLNSPSNSLTAISPSSSATFGGGVTNTTYTSASVNNNGLTTTLTTTANNLLLVDDKESNSNKHNILSNALAETFGNDLGNASEKLNTITEIASHKQQAEMRVNLSNPSLTLREVRKRKHKMPHKSKNHCEGELKMHTFPNEATTNNNENATISSAVKANNKLHRRLFFAHELCIRSDDGRIKDRILNLSSCSSSCTDSDESNGADDDLSDHKTLLCRSKSEDGMKFQLQLNKSNNSVIQSSNDQINLLNTAAEFVKIRQAILETAEDEDVQTSLIPAAEFVTRRHIQLEEEVRDDTNTENMVNQLCSNNDYNIATNNINNEKSSELTTTSSLYEANDLPKENNDLLLSFNNIYYAPCSQSDMTTVGGDDNGDTTQLKQREDVLVMVVNKVNNDDDDKQLTQLRNEKCDDYNNMYNINNNNNNNFNLINYDNEHSLTYDSCRNSCSKPPPQQPPQYYAHNNNNIAVTTTTTSTTSAAVKTQNKSTENHLNLNLNTQKTSEQQYLMEMIPFKEYRTGLRAVDEDVDDEDGNNCARIQQFKEWHQVLQLRSYDDELLTILPYVVLD